MLNFSQYYLSEAQKEHSVFDSIVNNAWSPPVFFTNSVMKRLEYSIPDVKAFHSTDLSGARGLISKQNRKNTQISVFTNPGPSADSFLSSILGGIETSGGVIVELEGTINVYFSADAFTARTKGGRRTVLIGERLFRMSVRDSYKDIGGESAAEYIDELINELQIKLQRLQNDVLNKHVLPLIKKVYYEIDHELFYFYEVEPQMKQYKEWKTAWDAIQFLSVTRDVKFDDKDLTSFIRYYDRAGKVMNKVVKDYMDGMERILVSSPDYKKIFLMPYIDPDEYKGTSIAYDEAILSDFTIKQLHIFPTRSMVKHFETHAMTPKEQEDYIDHTIERELNDPNVDIRIWLGETFINDLYKYIKNKSKKFVDIYRKKVGKL